MTDIPEHERPIEERIAETIARKAEMLAAMGQAPEKPAKRSKKS